MRPMTRGICAPCRLTRRVPVKTLVLRVIPVYPLDVTPRFAEGDIGDEFFDIVPCALRPPLAHLILASVIARQHQREPPFKASAELTQVGHTEF